jgi:hypothetical protein
VKGKVHSLAPQAKAVLLKYNLLSTDINWDFFNTVKKDIKFNTQGWIISDHFPDGLDCKQLFKSFPANTMGRRFPVILNTPKYHQNRCNETAL